MPLSNRPFLIGFALTLALFLAVNLIAADIQSSCGLPGLLHMAGCDDDISRAGFPLVFYEEGGFAYRNNFSIGALGVDVFCGLGLATLGGMIVRGLW